MIAKKTSKNQLTIPKEIASQFPGIDYFEISIKENNIILKPVVMKPVNDHLSPIREKMRKLGINRDDINDAVAWARKNNK